ncbi:MULTISPECIES: SusC/RagA family TonB-linked outer membrane protein [Olivibacter]|uniref:SusC/RagA family TonB-linked outer membrane protein n=1 Tax=Olivibacter jilunii TaxID=985016 RepID=A0ABW6AXP1_9SPHI|nr:SusC/RagA family TonB-linked outer membrane protein [Olivibacter sp. UJ_SKK_5.1]MDX3913038.1 SusC/RagA family TonB-linked outer membrane protein [Pseudosphingobacterium sp.]
MNLQLLRYVGILLILLPTLNFARQRTITGTVLDENTQPIAGASVLVKNTTQGTQTKSDGTFSLEVADNSVLVISYVGYQPKEVVVGDEQKIQVSLVPDNQLSEVVVTALGIKREKKALGYVVQDVSGDVLNTRPTNALSAISGKVAGLQIIPSGGNMGGSTRVLLRGIKSITGNNQPLYVIDGTPIDNADLNTASTIGGSAGKDVGNMIQDLNPDDIENISVLKGPSAALYGSRAANGVILITTKKGNNKEKTEISLNTGIELEQIVRLPKRQKLYGQGYSTEFPQATINGTTYNIVDYAADESWGPRLDGTPVLHWYNLDPGYPEYLNPEPWLYPEHDVNYFFRTGIANTNNLAIAGSSGKTSYRLSYTNKNVRGTVPNASLGRNTLSFSGSTGLGKVTISSNLNYVKNNSTGRPWTGASNRNIMLEAFQWGGVQVDYKKLSDYKRPDGTPRPWNRTGYRDTPGDRATRFIDNPYWSAYESYLEESRDRLYGNVGVSAPINSWLNLSGKVYADIYQYQYQDRIAVYSRSQSMYQEYSNNFHEFNYEFLATANKQWTDFSLSGLVGGNIRDANRRVSDLQTGGPLVVPNYYDLRNSSGILANNGHGLFREQVYSIFGSFSAGWKNMLYLDGTLRNDWWSTLPTNNNSFYYPSLTSSFVFSELEGIRNIPWIDYAKFRLGWAEVGNGAAPYSLAQLYSSLPAFNGQPSYTQPDIMNNPNLKPELTSTWETGFEFQLFKNRLGLDVTYYNNRSRNQTIAVPTSDAFGYQQKFLNAGLITNKGFEVILTGAPIKNDRFEWNSSVNWSLNRNKIARLYEGISTLELNNTLVSLVAQEGESYGQIRGYDFVYAPDGQRVVQEDGTYLRTSQMTDLGTVLPDYLVGFQNSFKYKNFTLGFLIDARVGGHFFSQTYKVGMYAGILDRTAVNNIRETGIVVDGVKADVQFNPDGSYNVTNTRPNDTRISAQTWARNEYNGPTTFSVFDATFVKLREITLGYNFQLKPDGVIKTLGINAYGRNLWNIYTKSKYIDPEFTNSGGNIQGIEGGNLPIPATYGLNVNVKF